MRDEHGRYQATKPVNESAPIWAGGCDKCQCGLIDAPALIPVDTMLMERLGQYKLGLLTFCSCAAGKNYQARLDNYERTLAGEAKRHPMMGWYAQRSTHPDIESVMERIVQRMPAPTMHYEEEPVYEYAHR